MPQPVSAQNFHSVMRNVFAQNDDYVPRSLMARPVHPDAEFDEGLLDVSDIYALRQVSRPLRELFPADDLRHSRQAAVVLLAPHCRFSIPIGRVSHNIAQYDASFYAQHGLPHEHAKRLLWLTKNKGATYRNEAESDRVRRSLIWFATVAQVTKSDGGEKPSAPAAVDGYRRLSTVRYEYAVELYKHNALMGSFSFWLVLGYGVCGAVVTKRLYAAARAQGSTALTAAGVAAPSAFLSAFGFGLGGWLLAGSVMNACSVFRATKDLWGRQYDRDALLFYMMSRHRSYDVFDLTLSAQELRQDAHYLSRGFGDMVSRPVVDLMRFVYPKDKTRQWEAEWYFQP